MVDHTWQPETMDEPPIRYTKTFMRVFYQNSVTHVCNRQVLSEINNRTYLSATANAKCQSLLWLTTFIWEPNIVQPRAIVVSVCDNSCYCSLTIKDYL